MTKLFKTVLVALMLLPSFGIAQNLQKGLEAYEAEDYATALKEWRPLAEQGDAEAQYNLGNMFSAGEGVAQDFDAALKWYRLAAEQGVAVAQRNLGYRYLEGEGVLQDYAEALKWFRLAAEQGYANAQYNVGYMYEVGIGAPQDNQTAHMWYNIASANDTVIGGSRRDMVSRNMTPADISEAQRRAKVCMESNYTDCD